MTVIGNVDSIEGLYVRGWAANTSGEGVCSIVIVNEQGVVVGRGRAARHRPDLHVLNLGRTTFGFRVPAKTTTKISRLKVVANGVVLGGQPIELGPNRFDGYCSINDDRIVGWVAERSIEKKAPLITVINQDGKIIASKYSKFDLVFCDRFVNRAIFSIVVDCNMLPEELQNISILANGVPFFKIILASVDKG